MLNFLACENIANREEDLAADQRTKAGSKDTDAKLLAVNPAGPLTVCVVMTVTPVTKRPKASRKSRTVPGPGCRFSIFDTSLIPALYQQQRLLQRC